MPTSHVATHTRLGIGKGKGDFVQLLGDRFVVHSRRDLPPPGIWAAKSGRGLVGFFVAPREHSTQGLFLSLDPQQKLWYRIDTVHHSTPIDAFDDALTRPPTDQMMDVLLSYTRWIGDRNAFEVQTLAMLDDGMLARRDGSFRMLPLRAYLDYTPGSLNLVPWNDETQLALRARQDIF